MVELFGEIISIWYYFFTNKVPSNSISFMNIYLFNPPNLTSVTFGKLNFSPKFSIYLYRELPEFPNRHVTGQWSILT